MWDPSRRQDGVPSPVQLCDLGLPNYLEAWDVACSTVDCDLCTAACAVTPAKTLPAAPRRYTTKVEAAGPVDEFDTARPAVLESMFLKGQSRRIWAELYKVLDSSDVVIQVLN